MTANHKTSEQLVRNGVNRVFHHAQHVETGENRLGEFDILLERDGRVVPSSNRVSCSDDSASRLQSSDDAGFGDGYGLLFHSLVDRRTISIVHLVELVDQAGSLVGQDQRATLQGPFPRNRILAYTRGETYRGCTLTGREHRSMCGFLNVFEEL